MTMNLRLPVTLLSASGIVLLLACSGGGGGGITTPPTPVYATSLDYTNPTGGTYRLVKNTLKSGTDKLVLDLEGPVSPSLSGVAFVLSVDSTRASWVKVDTTDAELVQNGAFTTAQLVAKAKASGNELQAGLFHKGGTALQGTGTVVLGRVALSLKSGLNLPQNTTVTFSAVSNKAKLLNPAGASQAYAPVEVAMGALTAK